MKTSVALCTYNGEVYIAELLESLYNQTQKPDEIVICDDASSDGTVACVRAFFASHELPHVLVINEQNGGFFNNFKQAVFLCTGDLIFCAIKMMCGRKKNWRS